MARNFTRELRKAHRPGTNKVVCFSAPYEGWEVEYSPRSNHDPKPWVLMNSAQTGSEKYGYGTDYRFTGAECHVQALRYIVRDGFDRGNYFVIWDTKTGTLARGVTYLSRYAATDAAERLEASTT